MKFYFRVLAELETEEKSFETIYKKAFSFKDKVMFEENENMSIRTFTYAECEADVKRAAFALSGLGLTPGDRIGICMPNSRIWAAVFFGTLMAGYIPLLLNPAAPSDTLEKCMSHAGAEMMVTEDGKNGTVSAKELLNAEGDIVPRFADEIILCTSGTMGASKLCAYSGKQIIEQILNAGYIIKHTPEIKNYYDKTGKNLKVLTLLPFCHIFGLVANLLWFSVFGQTFVELKSMNPEVITNTCRLHGVTHIFAPPLLWNTVEKSVLKAAEKSGRAEKLKKGIKLINAVSNFAPAAGRALARRVMREVQQQVFGGNVWYCISGGGAITRDTLSLINGVGYFLTNGYGMTEIGITSLVLSRKPKKLCSGTVGFPLPSAEYRLEENGGLFVKSASSFTAYYKDGARVEREDGGWFDTGDVFELTADGYLFKGREDDMINGENGERIGPDEIEAHFASSGIASLCACAESSGGRDAIILVAEPVSRRADVIYRVCSELIEKNDALPIGRRASRLYISGSPLPVSLNAKVNRRAVKEGIKSGALPVSEAKSIVSGGESAAVSEAKRELSEKVISIFAEILEREKDGMGGDTSFVSELSGTSLEYYMLLDKIEAETGVKVNGALGLTTPLEFAEYILSSEDA